VLAAVLAAALDMTALAAVSSAPAFAVSPGVGWTMTPVAAEGSPVPDSFHYDLAPGQSASDRLALANGTPDPLTFLIYSADASNVPVNGAFALSLPNQVTQGVGSWTTTTVHTVTVPGLQVASFPFTVTVPAGATPGEYAGGVVALDTADQNPGSGRVHVRVLSGVGVRIYVLVPGPVHPRLGLEKVTAHAVVPFLASITGSGRALITFQLSNTGNTLIYATANVEVVDLRGRTVKRFAPKVIQSLLPGAKVTVSEPVWDHLPIAGPQHVHVEVTGGPHRLTGETQFWVVPWALILAGAVAVLAVVLAVVLLLMWRRRRRPSSRRSDSDAGGVTTGGRAGTDEEVPEAGAIGPDP
jgi:hypothetical protein